MFISSHELTKPYANILYGIASVTTCQVLVHSEQARYSIVSPTGLEERDRKKTV